MKRLVLRVHLRGTSPFPVVPHRLLGLRFLPLFSNIQSASAEELCAFCQSSSLEERRRCQSGARWQSSWQLISWMRVWGRRNSLHFQHNTLDWEQLVCTLTSDLWTSTLFGTIWTQTANSDWIIKKKKFKLQYEKIKHWNVSVLNIKFYTVIWWCYEAAALLETCFDLDQHFTHNSYQTFLTTS